MDEMIRILVVEVGKYPYVKEIMTDLAALQEEVGGYIEAIYPFDDDVALVCNEEGKIRGLDLNRGLKDEDGNVVDIIAGTFFICGLDEENFASLPDELVDKYEKLFHWPECFLKLKDKIDAMPYPPEQEKYAFHVLDEGW